MAALCRIKLSGRAIRLIGPPGVGRTLPFDDLVGVVVETHTTHGRVTDVWWLLYPRRGPALRVPQGSPGEKELVDWLMSLPGFDIDAMTRAMRFHGNATFELWKAPTSA